MYSGCYPLYESVEIYYELGVIYFFVRNDKQSLENIVWTPPLIVVFKCQLLTAYPPPLRGLIMS